MNLVWAFAILLMSTPQQQASPMEQQTHHCLINVVDSEGAVIGKAHIFIHRDPVASTAVPDRTFDADTLGKADVTLPGGFYDVCVMSAAFTPSCRKVVLHDRDANVKFRLSASPEVLEQNGDSFPTK